MDFAGVASVVGITVICYLAGMIAKATAVDNKWIPVIVGIAGAALGVAGMYVIKDFPATDVINALAVGIVSGLASTGADQIAKISKRQKGGDPVFYLPARGLECKCINKP